MYNSFMEIQKIKKTELTKEHRRFLREKQVFRQKLLLALLPVCFLAFILLASAVFRTGRSTQEQMTVNAACESYRPQVEEAAARYGMSGYVDLILALMMQESSGNGPDVMQSSEGAYNTRYPQVPNGITDSAYSIECGIQELKYSMEKAGVKSPADTGRIKLALQGYNFGADVYFSYLSEHGIISWSEKSSEAFAEIASGHTPRAKSDPLYSTAGPWDYGDQNYPEHVLRYYHPVS